MAKPAIGTLIPVGGSGNAKPADLLVGKTASTDDGEIMGTMPNQGSKSFTPTDSTQSSGAGYYSGVTVNARPALSGNATTGQVLTGQTFYGSNYTKQTGTMTNQGSKAFTPTDSTQTSGAGYYSGVTVNARPALSGNASAAQVLTGQTFYGGNYTKQTGTMVNRGEVSNTITTQGGQYTVPAGYHSGSGKVTASFSNLVAGNIKKGVTVGGVAGSLEVPSFDITTWPQLDSMYSAVVVYKTVAYGNGLWLVANDYSQGSIYKSSDSINWDGGSATGLGAAIISVAHGNGLWVIGGRDGKLATSTNGTSWTSRTSTFGSEYIYQAAYGNGLWVIVGSGGQLATSTNGTSWTRRTNGFSSSNPIYGVAYGNCKWVVVGESRMVVKV